MPRFKLILNPASDRWHTKDRSKSLRQLIEGQGGAQAELSWVITDRPRHAVDLAREAAAEGYDLVVAVGGDGTVHEVVNGLMEVPVEQRPRLGIIPVGSGNDFAYNVGIPRKVEEAVDCLFNGTPFRIDVGTITDGTGRMEYWDNTVGIGFSGAVNIASRKVKRLRGFLVYLTAVLQTIFFNPQKLKASMEIDGQSIERSVAMLSVCNGPREGGGFPVAPHAKIGDGLLSYTIMRGVNQPQMLFFLPIVLSAQHLRFKAFFQPGEACQFNVKTDKTMAIHIDGEVFGPWEADVRHVEIGIVPGALEVIIAKH